MPFLKRPRITACGQYLLFLCIHGAWQEGAQSSQILFQQFLDHHSLLFYTRRPRSPAAWPGQLCAASASRILVHVPIAALAGKDRVAFRDGVASLDRLEVGMLELRPEMESRPPPWGWGRKLHCSPCVRRWGLLAIDRGYRCRLHCSRCTVFGLGVCWIREYVYLPRPPRRVWAGVWLLSFSCQDSTWAQAIEGHC